MNMAASKNSQSADFKAEIRQIRFQLRSDLQISRQIYQGDPVYVVHDPVSFRTHRLSLFQYRTLALLNPARTVGGNFKDLVARDHFSNDGEETFHELISSLARPGLIVLSGASGPSLYKKYQQGKTRTRQRRTLGFLFLQVPLVNPDRFLSRTVHHLSWLFTRSFLVVWLCALMAAGLVICNQFTELVEPLNGILAAKSLPFLWVSFVALKIWHELGHGYACRKFGGAVPEMGMLLIAGTPAAFVDATSAWSFPKRSQRLLVMCGGMYFESLVAIPGLTFPVPHLDEAYTAFNQTARHQ